MLGTVLADLYCVETRALIQAVRRNAERFPPDFMLPLTRTEIRNISQSVISSRISHACNVFTVTEQGLAVLSSVLCALRAVRVDIPTVRCFARLRATIDAHEEQAVKLGELKSGPGLASCVTWSRLIP